MDDLTFNHYIGLTDVTVDGARIILREGMIASNGAVHVIDRVLLPTDSISTIIPRVGLDMF